MALLVYWTEFTSDYKQILFSLRDSYERGINSNLHALGSFYHTEILLHVLINLVWLSLTEKDLIRPYKVWDLETQGTSILWLQLDLNFLLFMFM